ncbi:MAG: 6-phosphofructokinase [Candidatus Omnitrophica bacterium]|nr:6-phosphofructokinase [Candidatus Omnitrophota bacterium]
MAKKAKIRRIAILTAGGDCPGLNAVIRAVSKKAILDHDMEVIGIADGYDGLIHNRHRKLEFTDVSGILTRGGTILGTSNIANPYRYPVKKGKKIKYQDVSATVIKNIEKLKIECLVCVGGDGTMAIAHGLMNQGVRVIGIPKTIDNDLKGTDITFGFNSAVNIATEAIDRIHDTAQSHHRVMIIEVMGRKAGWIALYSGVAGGADLILLPEIPYDMDIVTQCVKMRHKKGKRFSIIAISEGAKPKGGKVTVRKLVTDGSEPVRLGGVGVSLGDKIENLTGIETRTVVLGHLQRGGSPIPADRILGTELGAKTIDFIIDKKFGCMVGVVKNQLLPIPLDVVAQGSRLVPLDHELIRAARSVGTCFGDCHSLVL